MEAEVMEIVMTPLRGPPDAKVLRIERVKPGALDETQVQHIAGGPYKGIVINKAKNEKPSTLPPDCRRGFYAHIAPKPGSDKHLKESRQLRFWFIPHHKKKEKTASKFFEELMNPDLFPKDHISFVKRVIQLVWCYPKIRCLELEVREEPETERVDGDVVKKTAVTTTVSKETLTKVTRSGATQEDVTLTEDGQEVSAHGTLQNGTVGTAAAIGAGAALDRSARTVPAQDDITQQSVHLQQTHGEFAQSQPGSAAAPGHGASLDRSDRTVPMQDDLTKQSILLKQTHGQLSQSQTAASGASAGPIMAEKAPTLGDQGNRYYGTDLLEKSADVAAGAGLQNTERVEEVIQPARATITGPRGNQANQGYLAKLQAEERQEQEEVIQKEEVLRADTAPITGDKGNLSYLEKLRMEGTEQQEQVVSATTAPITGDRGNLSYLDKLKADGEATTEEVISSSSTVVTGGDQGNLSYLEKLKMDAEEMNGTVTGSSSTVVVTTRREVRREIHTTTSGGVTTIKTSQENRELEYGEDGRLSVRDSTLSYTDESPAPASGALKRQPTITRRGWAVVWATKKQRILDSLEDAYPNILGVDDLVRTTKLKRKDVEYLIEDIASKGLVSDVGRGHYIRVQKVEKKQVAPKDQDDTDAKEDDIKPEKKHEFRIVAHVPRLPPKEQPTVALITLFYNEKLAVDAMMDSKTTYVRYKTDGEGQVYTIGFIGKHKVVATKLSRIGRGQASDISAENTITRLLGTFGKIEHVFLVGVGGGVAAYSDDHRHVRLGDVVVSKPEYGGGPIYIHCTDVDSDPAGGFSFGSQSWNPREDDLESLVDLFLRDHKQDAARFAAGWEQYIAEGLEELQGGEMMFNRPRAETDILYKMVKGKMVEVPHPHIIEGSERSMRPNHPILHYGAIGSGKKLSKDDAIRQEFALFNEIKVIDPGFRAVMDSIDGNRKDSFAIVRGISDYTDGTGRKEWQPYAALVAAAVMKALVLRLPIEEEEDDY